MWPWQAGELAARLTLGAKTEPDLFFGWKRPVHGHWSYLEFSCGPPTRRPSIWRGSSPRHPRPQSPKSISNCDHVSYRHRHRDPSSDVLRVRNQAYGLTETNSIAVSVSSSFNTWLYGKWQDDIKFAGDDYTARPTSTLVYFKKLVGGLNGSLSNSGLASPVNDIRIVHEGICVPARTVGEVWLWVQSVMSLPDALDSTILGEVLMLWNATGGTQVRNPSYECLVILC